MRCSFRLAALWALAAAVPAQSPLPFTEEGQARGLTYVFDTGPSDEYGQGVCFADLDVDGDADVVLIGNSAGTIGVFENDGTGHFVDRTGDTTLAVLQRAVGISSADYDADGDPDLHIAVHDGVDALIRNDGAFRFKDVSEEAGVAHAGFAQAGAWGDYDGDGWLDLYVSIRKNVGGANLLYHNRGDGTFEEVAAQLGVAVPEDGMTYHTSFVDYNADRRPDLYVCSDKGQHCTAARNHLFENRGLAFENVTEASGTEACVACMGTAVGDFDANGHTDFYCTNLPSGNVLLLGQGDGTFREDASTAGVVSWLMGWGTLFVDYDNDTYLDLYVCNLGPNRMYENDLVWPCPDVAPQLDLDTELYTQCVAAADIDNDGDLDLLVQAFGAPVQLFVNHEGSLRNWLQVETFGQGANTAGIGARVVARTGTRTQYREVRAGVGFKSANSLVVHFGLGDAQIVDELRVEWPWGGDTVMTDVAVNQRIAVMEGDWGRGRRFALPR